MLIRRFTLLATLAGLPLAAANTGNCNLDVPLTWTVNNTSIDGITPSLVVSDGSPYINGQSGVSEWNFSADPM